MEQFCGNFSCKLVRCCAELVCLVINDFHDFDYIDLKLFTVNSERIIN